MEKKKIPSITHPSYSACLDDWKKWRLTYTSGDEFVETYLQKFSNREEDDDYKIRRAMAPIPAFAKGAVNEIKNAIFQRMADITRNGGPANYQEVCQGRLGGVDLRGATMNWFIGHHMLPELLTMKRVGVFVDNKPVGPSLADKQGRHPYIYVYKAEDIRSWAYDDRGNLVSVLLRDTIYENDPELGLPSEEVSRFRHLWILPTGYVAVQFYSEAGDPISQPMQLGITKIPFVISEISDSLLRDVANHQIALLNLESSDLNYALKSNFPFYVEQYDARANSSYLKNARQAAKTENQEGGEPSPTASIDGDDEVHAGVSHGRKYAIGTERPGFIAPPTDPLIASMSKQKNLKDDIRLLVHLALSNIQPKMASAESKAYDQHGLESGLSYIGLELEHAERQIAHLFAMYEGSTEVPTVIYPKKYSLKTEEDIRKDIEELDKIRDKVASPTFRREVTHQMATAMLGLRVSSATMDKIHAEINEIKVLSADPDTIKADHEAGFVSDATASQARGYPEDEVSKAQRDHAKRLARIQKAQTPAKLGARGIKDASVDPNESRDEKKGKAKRGEGK